MRILRAADRIAVPWKNGGGVTREVCAMPQGAQFDFGWRLSLAEVRVSGPFSCFAEVDRKLAVIKGRMRLSVNGHMSPDLLPNAPALAFRGEAETISEVFEPVMDANLMTRRGVYCGLLEWIDVDREVTISDQHADTILLAVDPAKLPEYELRPFDAAWRKPGSTTTIRPITEPARMLIAKIWRTEP